MTGWKDSLQRRDEVKAAFAEGYRSRPALDEDCRGVERAWTDSNARRKLEEPLEEKPE